MVLEHNLCCWNAICVVGTQSVLLEHANLGLSFLEGAPKRNSAFSGVALGKVGWICLIDAVRSIFVVLE